MPFLLYFCQISFPHFVVGTRVRTVAVLVLNALVRSACPFVHTCKPNQCDGGHMSMTHEHGAIAHQLCHRQHTLHDDCKFDQSTTQPRPCPISSVNPTWVKEEDSLIRRMCGPPPAAGGLIPRPGDPALPWPLLPSLEFPSRSSFGRNAIW